MSCFIHTSATISVQKDLSSPSRPEFPAQLVGPDYKALIPSNQLRRMSNSIRMGVWCANSCGLEPTDPIIIGTGLGCLADSEKFLNSLQYRGEDGPRSLVSPTPFILSTHNTIGGQIALLTENRSYNVTHVQNGHSFETAMIDAMLLLNEDTKSVLVGGVEENIPLLSEIASDIGLDPEQIDKFTEGAGFFRLKRGSGPVEIEDCSVIYNSDLGTIIAETNPNKIDLILLGQSGANTIKSPNEGAVPTVSYSDLCGLHMSNVAFGMDLGFRLLIGTSKMDGIELNNMKHIRVINSYNDASFGVIDLRKQ